MSASIISVRLPAWQNETARLASTVVLPSPGSGLEMTSRDVSRPENARLVRSVRKASLVGGVGSDVNLHALQADRVQLVDLADHRQQRRAQLELHFLGRAESVVENVEDVNQSQADR